MIEDLTDRALGRTTGPAVLSRPASRSALHDHLAAIVANTDVDAMPVPAGASKGLKRMVLKLTGFSFARQAAVNRSIVGVVNGLVQEIDHLQAEIQQTGRRSAAAVAAFEASAVTSNQHHRDLMEKINARVTALDSTLAGSGTKFAALTDRLGRLNDEMSEQRKFQNSRYDTHDGLLRSIEDGSSMRTAAISDLSAELNLEASRRRVVERQIGLLKDELRRQNLGVNREAPASELDEIAMANLTEVYERFEAHFRPANGDLTGRFEVYLDDLAFLSGGSYSLLDIGTGRGDFLTVLKAASIPARGLDLNPEAVSSAAAKGLDVVLADASEYLAQLANESIGAVSALHVVEHLDPNVLIKLIDEIVRVLIPGGVLIFETPNPTNLAVGASSFYHDPTHHRPVTPDYLSFLLSDRGLTDVKTKFLNPLPEFASKIPPIDKPGFRSLELLIEDVRWALKGPQEYAVIGRRPGTQ